MKKKALTLLLALTLGAALFCGCGDDSSETKAAKEESSSSEGTFSLLDVDENMVDVGVYGKDDDGTELVFTMFTGPDGKDYVSLFGFDNNDNTGDVICGQYEASVETDEDGDNWTYFTVSDVYTESQYTLGVCERPETKEVVFFNKNGDVIEGKYLSSAETINYMGAAVALMS